MKNIFNEFKRQIFSPFNISIILIIFLIILYPISNHIEVESQLLQGGTMLLYSLYIPIAIAILESELKYRSKSNISLKIIFTKIFNISTHLIIIISTLISVLLIDTGNNNILEFIGLIIYISSNVCLVNSIFTSKEYLASSNKAKYGFELIKNNESKFIVGINDICDAIPDNYSNIKNVDSNNYFKIWNYEEENSFIELIFNQTDKYKNRYQFQNIYDTLNVIYKNITKINLSYRSKLFITKLFEYIYIFRKESEESAEHNGSPSKYIEAYEIYRISEEILIKILQKSLQDPHPTSASIDFFEALDQHLQKYKDETIKFNGNEKSYFEFFKYFGDRVITEILNSKDEFVARDVLDYQWSKSDRNWKINLSNLESKQDNKITDYWLNRMLEYLYKIWKEQIFYSSTKKLESKDIQKVNILINAFMPDIDVILFMRVVELVWFKRVVKENVKNYLEKRVFWFLMGNEEVYIDNSSPEENLEYEKNILEKQQRETVLLLKKICQLNDNFYKDIQSQIEAIDRNSLDDDQKERLKSLQKTIEYFKDIK